MFQHPVWQAGFRPFFPLAALAGALLPLYWVALLTGLVPLPRLAGISVVQWHAHEMLYGFGLAVLIGFLLTASKNWLGTRGYQGAWLGGLAAAWALSRLAMAIGGSWPAALFWPVVLAFTVTAVAMLLASLIRHRQRDGFGRDNRYFIVALPLFLPAQVLLLQPEFFAAGSAMSLALFRLCFLLMLERTLPAFMQVGLGLTLPRLAWLDHAIKGLALALVAAPCLPPAIASILAGAAGVLLLGRFIQWQGVKALRRIDVGIMFVGYLAIAGQLLVESAQPWFAWHWTGSFSTHLFTTGAMGCIVPAMFIRIASGHTGRKIVFGALEKAALWAVMLAAVARVGLPQVWPEEVLLALWLAALGWSLAFGLWLGRYLPRLLAPRADGRPG